MGLTWFPAMVPSLCAHFPIRRLVWPRRGFVRMWVNASWWLLKAAKAHCAHLLAASDVEMLVVDASETKPHEPWHSGAVRPQSRNVGGDSSPTTKHRSPAHPDPKTELGRAEGIFSRAPGRWRYYRSIPRFAPLLKDDPPPIFGTTGYSLFQKLQKITLVTSAETALLSQGR